MSKMALKLLFFCCKITKLAQRLGASPPDPRPQLLVCAYLVIMPHLWHAWVASVSLARGLNQTSFVQNKKLLVLPSLQNSGCVTRGIHSCSVDRFFRQLWAADETSYIRNVAGPIFFLDMNAQFLKLHIFVAVQGPKISFYMQKFSLF